VHETTQKHGTAGAGGGVQFGELEQACQLGGRVSVSAGLFLHRAATVSEGPWKSPRRERQPSRTHPHPPARPSLPLPVPVPCTHASRVLGHQGFPCSHHAPSTDHTWRLPRTPQHESWRVHPPNEAGPAAPSSIRSHQRTYSARAPRHTCDTTVVSVCHTRRSS
jgi:hypothetical protein